MRILFLDFDGVLHPDAVYRRRGYGVVLHKPSLPPEFHDAKLFGYAGHLVDILKDFPAVRIVLSTSWVSSLRFSTALSRLPPLLQARVVGATYHSRQHTGLRSTDPLPADHRACNPSSAGSVLGGHRQRCGGLAR
jgi:hypothetical protein